MTLKEIIAQEMNRIASMLPSVDPKTDEYEDLLFSLDECIGIYRSCPDEINMTTEPVSITTEEPVLVKVPEEKPKPEEETAPVQVYDYNTVRAICAKANVPLRPIVTKYVPEGKEPKLSNVPEDRYAELVKEIEDAK